MTDPALEKEWHDAGYFLLPDFLAPSEIPPLRSACDHVLDQVLGDPANAAQKDASNIAFLTERKYFSSDLAPLLLLLELIASDRILSTIRSLGSESPLFHNTQYFYEQASRNWDGAWHRDTQSDATDPELERARMSRFTGLHFRVAFERDERLEFVPGSHVRWDTEEEFRVRKGSNPTAASMPRAVRLSLDRGDACVFHAWGIHRGTYRTDPARRTLDIIYGLGPPVDFSIPPPMCFRDPEVLAALSPTASDFFGAFVEAFEATWG